MDFRSASPKAVCEELGERLKQARLNANLTQAEVATMAGLSRKVVQGAESGKAQMESFVAIMSALYLVDQLDCFLPKQEISPIQLAKLEGKKRLRASGTKAPKAGEPPKW